MPEVLSGGRAVYLPLSTEVREGGAYLSLKLPAQGGEPAS